MRAVNDVLLKKLAVHSVLDSEDQAALASLSFAVRTFARGADIIKQGSDPDVSVLVIEGMVARYQTLNSGRRQYISFHIAGDWPDAQTLFIDKMDHALCAMSDVAIGLVRHDALQQLFEAKPPIGFAVWRETLIDAAIFRQTIVNNSAQPTVPRLAHFLCEQFYRAKAVGLAAAMSCQIPLNQNQLGETLGISVVTANRAARALTARRLIRWQNGVLHIENWERLCRLGNFNPGYLHLKRRLRTG